MNAAESICSPITIGNHTLKNRIVVPPMADIALSIPQGYINDSLRRRYAVYAAGGAGLITVEGSNVTCMPDVRDAIALWDDTYIPGLHTLAQTITQNGTLGLIQIMNIGLKMMKEDTIAAIPKSSFMAYQRDFVQGAIRCWKAGFDGIELHAAHGYFLNQIVETSDRTDAYGGTLEKRLQYMGNHRSCQKSVRPCLFGICLPGLSDHRCAGAGRSNLGTAWGRYHKRIHGYA